MKRVRHGKSMACNECNMKRVQRSATWKEYNRKLMQHEKVQNKKV